jgi:hypothetical protein
MEPEWLPELWSLQLTLSFVFLYPAMHRLYAPRPAAFVFIVSAVCVCARWFQLAKGAAEGTIDAMNEVSRADQWRVDDFVAGMVICHLTKTLEMLRSASVNIRMPGAGWFVAGMCLWALACWGWDHVQLSILPVLDAAYLHTTVQLSVALMLVPLLLSEQDKTRTPFRSAMDLIFGGRYIRGLGRASFSFLVTHGWFITRIRKHCWNAPFVPAEYLLPAVLACCAGSAFATYCCHMLVETRKHAMRALLCCCAAFFVAVLVLVPMDRKQGHGADQSLLHTEM